MPNKPNVLLIMSDQHTWKVSGYRGDPLARTENLDRIARDSVDFTNAITPSAACTPARMSMLTGKEPYNCSAWANHWVIFPEHTTWPAHFAEHGYSTALIGKMHFGGKDQMHGYQRRPYGDLRHGLAHQPEPLNAFPAYGGAQSAGVTEIPESLNSDVVITREAISYLLEHQENCPDTPWFTTVSYTRPHSPFTTPSRYMNRYKNKFPVPEGYYTAKEGLEPYARDLLELNKFDELPEETVKKGQEGYYACVDFVDDCIGELMDALRKEGMLENTYVIYVSDHGEMLAEHGMWAKAVYFENAIRIPMLIGGSGIKGAGGELDDPISLVDLFPTVCGLTGLPIPEGIDGLDFSSRLLDPENSEPPRKYTESMFCKYGTRIIGGNMNAYAGKDEDVKPGVAMRLLRDREWKYVEIEAAEPLLFYLPQDPGEEQNLAGDPSQAERVKEMRAILEQKITWSEIHARLKADKERVPQFYSGEKPTTPNQYMLPDGRVFDAEKELYDARWLYFDPDAPKGGGIIPQMFG